MSLATESRYVPAWIVVVVAIWSTMMLQADLKVALLYIHWLVTAVALFALTPNLMTVKWKKRFPATIPSILLVIAVFVPSLYSAKLGYSLAEAGKLSLLLGGLAVFTIRSEFAHYAFRGFVLAVWINLLMLIGGMLGSSSAHLMSAGRWGTLFNFPGSLSRLGIAVFVYALYLAFRNRSLGSAALAAASTALVYFDGSRTSLLLALTGIFYVILVLGAESGRLRLALGGTAFALVGVFAVTVYLGSAASQSVGEQGGLRRLGGVAGSMQEGVAGLETADLSRFRMFQDGIEAVQSHPILGTGISTTTSETPIGPMVIHMTYLQVWADLGLLGLVSFVWIIWGWLAWVPSAWRKLRILPDPHEKAVYHNSIFLLFFNGVAACFHPMSTEWSEWVLFIIPYALLWEIGRRKVVVTVRVEMAESYA